MFLSIIAVASWRLCGVIKEECMVTEIAVCMGSSCFSRGNAVNAEVVQRYIEEHDLGEQIAVTGCLCENKCKKAPNVKVDGKTFSCISAETLPSLLDSVVKDSGSLILSGNEATSNGGPE
jgi:NADH:ubiquinone oxidoreductase subunit E